jgi:hypothetical protein
MMQRLLLLSKSKTFGVATAVVVIGSALAVQGADPDPDQLQAAASLNTSAVSLDGLRCLSIDPRGLTSVALVGLARSQVDKWEVLQSTRLQ